MKSSQNSLEPAETVMEKFLRRKVKLPLAAVFVFVLAVAAFAAISPQRAINPDPGAEMPDSNTPTVAVVVPQPGKAAAEASLPAEIKPWIEAPIHARASGFLKRRFVDIGDRVKAGRVLAEIDTPELDEEVERARAQLAQAEASLEIAGITAKRWTGLLKSAGVSQQETAEKQADFKLKTAITQSARAEVRRLERLKSFANVSAPFDGTVTVRNVEAGDLIVAGGGRELFHLAQTEMLRVCTRVPQTMARGIECGQWAEITFQDLPGKIKRAKVVRTAGVIAPESRTLPVELELDNSKDEILAGGYALVRFADVGIQAALTVPANAVMFRADGPQAGIVLSGGIVELRKLKLGRDLGRVIEVVDGLGPDSRVIVNPPESLQSGRFVSMAGSKSSDGR